MNELAFASIKILQEKLARKEISHEELLEYILKRFEKHDPEVKSALEIFDKKSILENLPSQKTDKHTLWAIPGLIKDTICQKNRKTSCASKMLENFVSPYDATVSERLKLAGALSIGRSNCDEFAMGSSGETSAFAKTANPWDLSRVPGGSSSGSAAAVAAGLVPWALGSETGGSIRQPSALCGTVGMKPTYGRVSRYGLVAYASSLDQVGPITRTVYDNALVLTCIAGQDKHDSTTRVGSDRVGSGIDYTAGLTGKIKPGLKIGVIDNTLEIDGFDPEVRRLLEETVKHYEKLGAEIVHLRLPLMEFGAAIYFVVSRAEAASNLSRFDGVRYGLRAQDVNDLQDMYARTRALGFGHCVKQRILIGNYVLSAGYADEYYKSAKKVQGLLRAQFLEAFKSVDVLFSPVSPAPAFKFDAFAENSLAMDLQDYFTASANLTGIPAIALGCGFTKDKLPVGFQLIGPDLSEALLYQTAYAYEQTTSWHTMHPEKYL